MKKPIRIALFALAGLMLASAGAAGTWWSLRPPAPAAAATADTKPAPDKNPPKYVSLEKVIVMLKREANDTMSHYLVVDLVFETAHEKEKLTKEHLPMLRSVAVRSLSALTAAKASAMSIDQFAEEMNRAYGESYADDKRDKPFSDVMIGKLIIE